MEVEIAKINIGTDRREVDENAVRELAESIHELGLMNPIIVDTEFNLIAGLHRVKAFEVLGLTSIKYTMVDFKGLRAKLAEIDENFVRSPLSEWERCEALSRRKKIYEELHPETKNGGDRRSKKTRKAECLSDPEQPKTFTKDTAEKLGISQTGVARRVRIAEKVTPNARRVFEDSNEKFNLNEALKLARIDSEQQEEAARQYVAREISTISDYKPQEPDQENHNHQAKTDIRSAKKAKPKSARGKPAKGKAAATPADAERPDADSPPTLSAPKPPPVPLTTEGASSQTGGSHVVDGQKAERQTTKMLPAKHEPKQESAPCAPRHDASPKPAPPDQNADAAAADAAAKEKAKKALAASYKDPIIGRIVADMKDADMERPLTSDIFVGDFESAINALIKRIKWFDIQEYQDIFAEVTEEQFQKLREIENRAYSCLDNFMKNVKEKMNA